MQIDLISELNRDGPFTCKIGGMCMSVRKVKQQKISAEDTRVFRCFKKHATLTIKNWAECAKLSRYKAKKSLISFVESAKAARLPTANSPFGPFLCVLPNFYPSKVLEAVFANQKNAVLNDLGREKCTMQQLIEKHFYGQLNLAVPILEWLKPALQSGLVTYNLKTQEFKPGKAAEAITFDDNTAKSIARFEQVLLQEPPKKIPSNIANLHAQIEAERSSKEIQPVREYASKDEVSLICVAEPMIGSRFTDLDIMEKGLDAWKGKSPHKFAFVSGAIAGTFDGLIQIDRRRTIQEGDLATLDGQLRASKLMMDSLKGHAETLLHVLGDDDWRMAKDLALLKQLEEKNYWANRAGQTLGAELSRRVKINDYYHKLSLFYEVLMPYMHKCGRALYNADEVMGMIGIRKSEYQLVWEITMARTSKVEPPEEYWKVVDKISLEGQRKNEVVTPNQLTVEVLPNKYIMFAHNPVNFSDVTMYQYPMLRVESLMRSLGAKRKKPPFMVIGSHQEKFWATRVPGPHSPWLVQLPGLQNTEISAEGKLPVYYDNIATAKHKRQHGFRGESPSTGLLRLDLKEDGRIRWHLWNEHIAKVVGENKGKPEQKTSLFVLSDIQIGSITMWPEMAMKAADYALYERRAKGILFNGDIIHGVNYPQHPQESHVMRLMSVDMQQRFALDMLFPLLTCAPELEDVILLEGNHEWNTIGAKYSGTNLVSFLEFALKGYMKGSGKQLGSLKKVETISRLRWDPDMTHNPAGDTVYAPVYFGYHAGYKIAAAHLFNLKGQVRTGGSTPIAQQMNWISGLSGSVGDVAMVIGAHFHSPHMSMHGGKWLVHIPSSASQSGFELMHGLMAQVGFMNFEFSTKTGICVEFIPHSFLSEYKMQSPFYKGLDKDLKRPGPKERGFERGALSPLVEGMVDNIINYRTAENRL